MFRCPFCGQAHSINIDLVGERLWSSLYHPIDIVDGYYECQESEEVFVITITESSIEIGYEDGSYVPVFQGTELVLDIMEDRFNCPECGSEFWIEHWIECFKDPLKYRFESEDLCACGGELYMEQIEGTKKIQWKCEKCNWAKLEKIIDSQ